METAAGSTVSNTLNPVLQDHLNIVDRFKVDHRVLHDVLRQDLDHGVLDLFDDRSSLDHIEVASACSAVVIDSERKHFIVRNIFAETCQTCDP